MILCDNPIKKSYETHDLKRHRPEKIYFKTRFMFGLDIVKLPNLNFNKSNVKPFCSYIHISSARLKIEFGWMIDCSYILSPLNVSTFNPYAILFL